jgi:hypothetical protein
MSWLSSRSSNGPGGALPSEGFVLVGTLARVLDWASLLVIERPGHPEARLHVNGETRIALDGSAAPLRALRPGQPVRVLFDLVGDAAVAIEVALAAA